MVSRRPPPVSHLTFDKFTRAHTQALSLSPRSSSTAVSFTVITHDSALFVYSFLHARRIAQLAFATTCTSSRRESALGRRLATGHTHHDLRVPADGAAAGVGVEGFLLVITMGRLRTA